jgi:lysophospholipase L1-like esterase
MNRAVAASFIVLLVSCAISNYVLWAMGKAWFWGRAIRRFEKLDRVQPSKPGVIVFIGSSSINFWKTLARDMAPLYVINRGFGGSQMAHVTAYAARIVLPYAPNAVVVYAGENDLSWPWSKTPETVLHDFQEFVGLVQGQLPTTWIYFLSIKPTPRRWKQREKQRRTNQMIEDFCRPKPQVQFVDVGSEMLNSTGKPRRDLFGWDGLHPSKQCYALWTSILRPILLERFAAKEIASSATNRSDAGEIGCAGNSG